MRTGNAGTGNLLSAANARAQTLEQQPQGQPAATDQTDGAGRALDVVSDTQRGVARDFQDRAAVENRLAAYVAGIESAVGQITSFGQAFVGEAQASVQQAQRLVESTEWSEAKGPLGKAAAAFGLLVSLEQVLSGPFSLIPFPALPAVRVGDLAFGLPHAHNHPPNLIPPAPPIPLPSLGPVIPLPWGISGAEKTLINGRPAARCGDMGIGIWCGGWFPLYEILLGSSSVWIEGARAARLGVDLTLHCLFSGVPKPSDIPILGVPLGFPVTASQNVIIGGFPLPSLLSLLLGVALRPVGMGLGRLANLALARRAAARAAREATSSTAGQVANSRGFMTVRKPSSGPPLPKEDILDKLRASHHTQTSAAVLNAIDNGNIEIVLDRNLESAGRTRAADSITINPEMLLDDAVTIVVHEGRHALDMAEGIIPAPTNATQSDHLFAELRAFTAESEFAEVNELTEAAAYERKVEDARRLAISLADETTGYESIKGITDPEMRLVIERFTQTPFKY